jgi:hypothetical protein
MEQDTHFQEAPYVYLFTHPEPPPTFSPKSSTLENKRPSGFQAGYFFQNPVWKGIELKTMNKHVLEWTEYDIALLLEK